ncbi:MAG: hypothetical protein H6774_01655, partial [Pseudomonadales bacterium]|nr:hypothetical protein [Pseudomonadales bacterium]
LLHGGAGAVVLYWLFLTLTTRHPHELQNVLVTNSYLPVLLALFIALFGISSFFWADARRGWITALGSTLLVFFRLQHVVFELWWLLPLLSIFGILLIVYKTKKTASS